MNPVDWRDEIVTVLGWSEGASTERSGRPAGSMADSPAERRFEGAMAVDATVAHIVELGEAEAAVNNEQVAPAHLVVGLLTQSQSVAAAATWLGMTVGRVRSAAGLRNERRVVAGGAPPGRAGGATGPGTGPIIPCGGGSQDVIPHAVAAGTRGGKAEAVVVDLAWNTEPPRQVLREGSTGPHVVLDGPGQPVRPLGD